MISPRWTRRHDSGPDNSLSLLKPTVLSQRRQYSVLSPTKGFKYATVAETFDDAVSVQHHMWSSTVVQEEKKGEVKELWKNVSSDSFIAGADIKEDLQNYVRAVMRIQCNENKCVKCQHNTKHHLVLNHLWLVQGKALICVCACVRAHRQHSLLLGKKL